ILQKAQHDALKRRPRSATEASPDRQINRLNILRTKSGRRTQANTVNRVNVGAAVEQKLDDLFRPSDYRSMKRRTTCAIPTVEKRRIGVEECAHARKVARTCSSMNFMVLVRGRLCSSATLGACFLE